MRHAKLFSAVFGIALFCRISTSAPAGDGPVPIPELARWESQMIQFGKKHGERLASGMQGDEALGSTYYDAQRVFFQIADYTGDKSWETYAQLAEKAYRDDYVMVKGPDRTPGGVPGYWNFTHGLRMDYERTKDEKSREAAITLSTNAAYTSDITPLEWTRGEAASREVAYTIMAYINAERLGHPRRERLRPMLDQALGLIDQWFVQKSSSDWAPFMFGLTAEALINYYEHIEKDPRILPALKLGADTCWKEAWIPEKEAFWHRANEKNSPAADVSLLVAPIYAWFYLQTGDVTYRDRGDRIFAGAVKNAWLDGAKQFNQNYRWSFDYVKWRQEADKRLVDEKK